MPRSSKHKQSKHSSRDATEFSDSEKNSSLKERKSKEESVTKVSDSSSGEKRKLQNKDAKDLYGAGNGEHSDEHGSSKRRKERSGDGVGDRWNAGNEKRPEGSKKLKASGDSKSRRRDETMIAYGDGDEARKSTGKGEGKHRDASKGGETGKERTFKVGRSERLVDNEEKRPSRQVVETTDLNAASDLQSAEPNGQLNLRMKKRGDGIGEGGKHADEGVEVNDRKYLSKDGSGKDGRQKEEKQKDEKYRDKHREDLDRDSKHRHEKQRDDHALKEHIGSWSDEKHSRGEKEAVVSRQKKIKSQGGIFKDRDNYDYDHDRDRDRDHDRDRDWEWEHGRENDRKRDHDSHHDRDCYRDNECDRMHERDRHHGRDGRHIEYHQSRYKDGLGKERSLDDRDDYIDSKSRAVKAHYSYAEKKTLSTGRADSDLDRVRSQSHQVLMDAALTSNQKRSPVANSHFSKVEYRILEAEDVEHRDLMIEHRSNGSRDHDKPIKTDDGPVDIPTERSCGSKASAIGLVERSPSATSIDCRYMNKGSMKHSLDFEESGFRNSIDCRDFNPEDRRNWDVLQNKPPLDGSTSADSSFYGRMGQGNAPGTQKIPSSRAGQDRPFMGSLEDDARDNSNSRYRKSVDPFYGRGPGNTWRGVPNWTSALPNNFVHFQRGPGHGGFQAMMPQFPPQHMFGARPPVEVNHTGFPYHIPEADRFSGHLRPYCWQNFMDGTGPPHLHGWDGNGSVFRDDPHLQNNSEWDRSRHSAKSQAWESGTETWKEHNGDVKKDFSPSSKDVYLKHPMDDVYRQRGQMANDETEKGNSLAEKVVETKSSCFSSANKTSNTVPAAPCEKTHDPSALSKFDINHFSHFYLSKLDISSSLSNPEVYDRCMALLIPKTSTEENDMVYGARMSAIPSKPSWFPLVDSCVFQRAMDLYKKHRAKSCIGSCNQTTGDKVPASYKKREVKEWGTVHKSNLKDFSMVSIPEIKNVPTPASDSGLTGSVAGKEFGPEMSSLDGVGCICSSPVKPVVLPAEASGNKELGERVPVSMENNTEDEESPLAMVNTGDANGNSFSPENDMNAKGNAIASIEDEMVTVGNSAGGPLIYRDGSSEAREFLMPESNESESLILSRILHSPESTR